MHLKRLKIVGFKSFATKTVLDFGMNEDTDKKHFDVTVVVGPNGSGKSNIVDAVRWVLGEQGMKNLRGKKSEDVIFAGSDNKVKLGSAQAALLLDNSDKKIPLDFEEIEVARKLYRSGESEYLINGSRVKLSELQDLLAKAGIGQNSYTIINQGMVDAVLNASPTERRSILESAAGVKPFQLKKERSLRRLDTARRNLERVSDLVNEIEPHLKTLKRQADKAAKGKEVGDKLKEKQLALYSYLWNKLTKEKGSIQEKKEELGRQMMQLQRKVDGLADEVGKESESNSNTNEKQFKLESEREKILGDLARLEKDLIITEGRIEIEKEKEKNFQMIETVPADLEYVKEKLASIRKKQDELVLKLEAVKTIDELNELKANARQIAKEIYEMYSSVASGKVQKKPSDSLETRNIVNLKVVGELKDKKEKLEEELKLAKSKLEEITSLIQKEIQSERLRRKAFFDLERGLREEQEKLDKLREVFNEAKIELARFEVREEDLLREIQNELGISTKDLLEKSEGGLDEELLRKDINRLKSQLEQIGSIDSLIVKEYEETNERYNFLVKESEDLNSAIEQLRGIVKEMEDKISRSFEEAFREINGEFSKYFRIIFAGGQASLLKLKIKSSQPKAGPPVAEKLKVDADDIEDVEGVSDEEKEETGIEIKAVPPGKKITNLSLLSGGERSLTSIALMFAIISYNPPPFAILDEVEAALDEANSKRFGKIITELSKNTQFVVITHNRETMRQASVLYGVTMGSDGVSKLLSIRLDQVGQSGEIIDKK